MGKLILIFVLAFSLLSFVACENFDDSDDDGIVIEEENAQPSDSNVDNVEYQSPYADPNKFYFAEHFDDAQRFNEKWVKSKAKKDSASEDIAKYDGVWELEEPARKIFSNDLGLVLKSKAKHAAIASRLNRPFVFSKKPLFVQYEVTMQDGQECGGSYIKLLSSGAETTDLMQFRDTTPYTIMFGPDKCGNDVKLHFIFRHVNPINGSITEKHAKKPKDRLEEPFKDKQPHLYQLAIFPDNTFKIRVDNNLVNEGSFFTDFNPPVNPPKEIDDPNDKKPSDWDEREKIPDPTAKKPDDWDEDAPPQIPDPSAVKPEGWLDEVEEMIPDPSAEKPADWDVEMDGEYEAPLIPNPMCEQAVGCGVWKAPLITNPDYKGKWRAPLLDNPNYQGKWAPRKIRNPDFFEDLNPFRMTTIAAVGVELWSMSADILFDNIIITDDEDAAIDWAEKTFILKKKFLEKQATTLWERMLRYMNYKPYWWAAYFVYCSVPITIYVVFLWSRRNKDHEAEEVEETFTSKIKNVVNENPWIVALMIVVVGLPICVVVYVACCTAPTKKEPSPNHPKKTDLSYPDDKIEALNPEEQNKNDLDVQENEVEDDEPEVEQIEEITNEEEPLITEIETKPVESQDSNDDAVEVKNTGARKRKPRRE